MNNTAERKQELAGLIADVELEVREELARIVELRAEADSYRQERSSLK